MGHGGQDQALLLVRESFDGAAVAQAVLPARGLVAMAVVAPIARAVVSPFWLVSGCPEGAETGHQTYRGRGVCYQDAGEADDGQKNKDAVHLEENIYLDL